MRKNYFADLRQWLMKVESMVVWQERTIITVVAVAGSLYQLYVALTGVKEPIVHRSIHVAFLLALCFLTYEGNGARRKDKKVAVFDWLFVLLSLSTAVFILVDLNHILFRWPLADSLTAGELVFGIILILLVLECIRRSIGNGLVIIILIFSAYTLFGAYMPGIFNHKGYSIPEFVDIAFLTTDGIFGIAIAASSTYVYLFILFGAFLNVSGAGEFFIDVSKAIAGRAIGGPAKIAVISSALFGSISGSPVSNVVTTGSFTIPLMKRLGYEPWFAGAVEAVASTGGGIMPPVMGVAAFLMAELTGIPYRKIAWAGLLPALLYYLGLLTQVHLRGLRLGLKRMDSSELPVLRQVMVKGWLYLIPFAVLIWAIVAGKDISTVALYSLVAVILVSSVRKETRMNLRKIIQAFEYGARSAVIVAMACAGAGLVMMGITMTGIGGKLTTIAMTLAGGNILGVLLVIAILCIILGMGMPVAAAYIVTAVLATPILISIGIGVMPAHLFTIYFAAMSAITPPVAVAAYAAASIADTNPVKICWQAVRLGFSAYLVPFFFVFKPSLLLQGSIGLQIKMAVISIIGIVLISAGVEGWAFTRMSWWERIVIIAAGLALIDQGIITNVLGFVFLGVVLFVQICKRRIEAESQQT